MVYDVCACVCSDGTCEDMDVIVCDFFFGDNN